MVDDFRSHAARHAGQVGEHVAGRRRGARVAVGGEFWLGLAPVAELFPLAVPAIEFGVLELKADASGAMGVSSARTWLFMRYGGVCMARVAHALRQSSHTGWARLTARSQRYQHALPTSAW